MTPQQRLTGQSALQAYRADIPGGAEPSRDDNTVVVIATLLRQSLAADAPVLVESPMVVEALAMARASLGPAMLAQGCSYDDHPSESFSDVIRLLAQRTDHAGRLQVAQHLLESAAEIERDAVEAGRILYDRARISRKLGHFDLASAQCDQLLREARRLRSPELKARAHGELAALGETRGNYVEMRDQCERSLRVARRAGLKRLAANAHAGVAKASAISGRFGDAIDHLWSAYELSGGQGIIARASLGNLAQTLLVSGRPAEARKISAMILDASPPILSALPSIGCYALASARLQDVEAVEWASGQVRRLSSATHHAHEIAEALMECGAALELIGRSAEGGMLRSRARAMAASFGFHAFTFDEALLSTAAIAPASQQVDVAAERVAVAIAAVEVPRFPNSLESLLV